MKKSILLIGCLVLLAIGIVTISCKKENKGGYYTGSACSCTVKGPDLPAEGYTVSVPQAYLDAAKITCSNFKKHFYDYYEEYNEDEYSVSCK